MIDSDSDWYALWAPSLAIVVAVLEEGHVTRAARRLGIAQPTVSRTLRRVEESLDVSLVHQSGRGVEVTATGRAFLPAARQTLATLRAARQELSDVIDPGRGRVSLAFLHTLGTHDVPQLIDAFRATWPDVSFDLTQGSADGVMDKLHAGSVDVVISAPLPAQDDRVESLVLREEELFLTVARRHRLAEAGEVDLRQFAEEPFVAMTPGHGLRHVFDDLCAEVGMTPHLEFLGEDVATLRGLVGAGLGVAVLPSPASPVEEVVNLRLREPPASRLVGATWPRTRMISPAARRFVGFLQDSGTKVLSESTRST